ncbi:MAG TPA: helix-turn-helix transcriptional regulator [Xanthobacteraceae bacterium]|nr:helix-turn-helix transcriptional regulator [Xanthobacteraceae bacterium]
MLVMLVRAAGRVVCRLGNKVLDVAVADLVTEASMTLAPLTALKDWREQQNPPLTQSQAARRIGVSRAAWSRWEAGRRKVQGDLVPKVAKKTGIPKERLRPDLVELLS